MVPLRNAKQVCDGGPPKSRVRYTVLNSVRSRKLTSTLQGASIYSRGFPIRRYPYIRPSKSRGVTGNGTNDLD